MHHPELAGDSASARKMAQAANCPRRAPANTTGGSSSVLTQSSGGAILSSNLMPSDDYKTSALIQTLPTAASSLGTQHPPPHSLNIHSQASLLPPGVPSSGAQIKKKSGFQITSVTPAQISVSTNNSITEDTESCDDLDESHTEDLSSSEILDVSLSRANDAAGPERSSSEDTLNNLHDAETPGAVSPNQPPLLPQTIGAMVNGAVHHHHQHTHHHHQLHSAPSGTTHSASAAQVGTQANITLGNVVMSAVTQNPGALPYVDQKMPSNVAGIVDNSTIGAVSVGQPLIAPTPGMSAVMASAASGATVSVKPLASNVNNLNSNVPGLGGISTNSVAPSTGLNNTNSQNVNSMHQQSSSSAITITTGTTASALIGSSSGSHVGITDIIQPPAAAPASNPQPQQTPMPAPHATSSRFRVVKLDSTSEPFKKGRWTCTEYYDKDGLATGSSENAPSTRTVESIRQFVPDNSEAVGAISVSSSVSTLSHYSEPVASGDACSSSVVQQSFPPPAHMPDYSMSANVSKPQMQPQKKANTGTQVPVSNQQQASLNMGGLHTTSGHPSPAVPPQQLTYAQTAQMTPAQNVPGVTQQQMAYPAAPQPAAAAQVAPVHVTSLSQGGSRPSDFTQSQKIIQVAASGSTQALTHLSTSMPPGNGQVMPASQPPVGNIAPAVAQSVTQGILQPQPTPQMVQAPTGGTMPQLVQSAGPGVVQQPPKGNQIPTQLSVEQQTPLSNQGIGAQFVTVSSSLPTSNVPLSIQSDPQAGLVQNGSKDGGAPPAVSALYANLPSLMATQLEDAQRLLIQHQSLLTFPKLATGDGASQPGTSLAPDESGGVSALTASASLLKNLPVDGEEDG
ncbi:TSC22 domain family protein 1 [Bagarius yarrelli]|uniref:TSC22 domain family protein 1 n=1 Tax=Bagarius yarrelli TaxID=175774 RepID=A0A556U4W4_BAGYA|nr:TSC22 domain family protein 1 [Bagarius yarrelli]